MACNWGCHLTFSLSTIFLGSWLTVMPEPLFTAIAYQSTTSLGSRSQSNCSFHNRHLYLSINIVTSNKRRNNQFYFIKSVHEKDFYADNLIFIASVAT